LGTGNFVVELGMVLFRNYWEVLGSIWNFMEL
jgi:hypothetical protein